MKGLEIHVGIAFDQNYLSPFYALATSIFVNNKKHAIVIHAIVSGVTADDKEKIKKFVEDHKGKIFYYEIDEKTVSQFVVVSKWTSAVYYRLYFPSLVPENVKRLLYLDTDTLVLGDIENLYKHDLEHYPVGAVYDDYVKKSPELGIDAEGQYFNSGVLLMDVKRWREQKISEQAFGFLTQFPEKIKYVDQDALNAVLKKNWKHLNCQYNTMYSTIPEGMSSEKRKQFIQQVIILHFTLQRPWNLLCQNRYRQLYFDYLEKSALKSYKKYTDFSWTKIPQLIKLRMQEFYFDQPVLQRLWRTIK